MKNRDYKIFAPNNYYHVFNRGNDKQDIFLDREDYYFFLNRLKEYLYPELLEDAPPTSHKYKRKKLPVGCFDLVCYCLMPNHFHWLIKQNLLVPISKIISKISTSYSIYFNKKYKHVGHVFQDQFKAVRVGSDEYLLWLSAYIHQNPKVAGLVDKSEGWQYSSYLSFLDHKLPFICKPDVVIKQFKNKSDYKNFVEKAFVKIKTKKDLEYFLLD